MVKVKEPPEELQRQKEDIENLLSSLETGFAEGSITQEHYNEVKQKNLEKLEEIKKKLKVAEKKVQKQTEKPEAETLPKEPLPKEEGPAQKEEKKEEKKPGILGEVSSKISGESEERIKEKIIMELSPKMEKTNLRLVKLKAFVDAMKEDKTAEREGNQHINEELGETRSALGSIEGRLSEMEMKLEDVSETLADLKPQRFAKELQKKEEELKMHDARLEKLDDMNSTILKRVNQIQIILEKLGNIESIATMTKDISKKLMSIDDKEKKITRLADKIDNMFVEINKRLEEFMFYKAKQDSLDDLSKEMLKSMDELTTKLTRYAEKDDLEILRDTLDNKINTISKETMPAAPSISRQAQQYKSEIESLMKLLDEQFKKGQISKKDYEKAKEANLQKIREMEGGPQKAIPMAETKETVVEQTPPVREEEAEPTISQEPEVQKEESGLAQAAKIAQPPESEPKKEEAKEKKEPAPAKPTPSKKAVPPKEEDKTVTKEELAKKIGEKPPDKKQKMLADLEYSFRKGLISQKAYETTQKMIMAKKF